MGLAGKDNMQLYKSEEDSRGWTHLRYQQYHAGIKVEGAQYYEHLENGFVDYAHGKLVENISQSAIPGYQESAALEGALIKIGADRYFWEDPELLQELREEQNDPTLTGLPAGELVFTKVLEDGEMSADNYALSWRFEINAIEPAGSYVAYVDAKTGEVLKVRDPKMHNGPAVLLHGYGTQIIDTRFYNGVFNDYHYLRALENSRSIHTKGGNYIEDNGRFKNAIEIKDSDDNWDANTSVNTTAHFVVTQAWDYFLAEHNRHGWDDNGIITKVWSGSDVVGAFYHPPLGTAEEALEFGEINGVSLATVDVGGHEYTHGMVRHLSGLGGNNEPGALNESFSDIFGTLVERFTFPGNFNWLLGEDAIPGGLRSMEKPPALGDPDTFEGAFWDFTGNDIHNNAGVQNRSFQRHYPGKMALEGTDQQPPVPVDDFGWETNSARPGLDYGTRNSNCRVASRRLHPSSDRRPGHHPA